jgi:hypothetical protein
MMKHSCFIPVILVCLFLGSSLSGKSLFTASYDQKEFLTRSIQLPDSLNYFHRSIRAEAGLGLGIAGEGGGLSGRLAFSYIAHQWGGMVRMTAFDGAKGTGGSGWFGPPVEKFYDKAILLSRIISKTSSPQTIASAGVGWMNGSRLTNQGMELEDIGTTPGFAFELGMATTGSTIGLSLGIMGNLNPESNLFGFFLSLTLGNKK